MIKQNFKQQRLSSCIILYLLDSRWLSMVDRRENVLSIDCISSVIVFYFFTFVKHSSLHFSNCMGIYVLTGPFIYVFIFTTVRWILPILPSVLCHQMGNGTRVYSSCCWKSPSASISTSYPAGIVANICVFKDMDVFGDCNPYKVFITTKTFVNYLPFGAFACFYAVFKQKQRMDSKIVESFLPGFPSF